jgi:Fe-S oxidoreductase
VKHIVSACPTCTVALKRDFIATFESLGMRDALPDAKKLADKVVVLSARPARVVGELTVDLPRPRDKKSKEFFDWVDRVYALLA